MPDPRGWTRVEEPNQQGLVTPGNIDLHHRPVVKNGDGSISTVRSISVNMDGKEVLIPTVSDDGRVLSNEDAIRQFKQTGKHLGIFDSPAHATAYAQQLHTNQAKEYAPSAWTKVEEPKKDAGYSPVKTIQENFGKFKNATFGDPVSMLSILGGMAAAVPTGGMSLLPSAMMVGGGSALGAGAGQLVSGEKPTLGTMAKAGAIGAATDATFGAAPIAIRGGVKFLKSPGSAAIKVLDTAGNFGVPMAKPAARILKLIKAVAGEAEPAAQEAAQATLNTGGRLVRPNPEPTIEKSIGQALEETRAAPSPKAISTPPQPSLPAGYTPRSRAATARVAVKTAPKAEVAPDVAPNHMPELPVKTATRKPDWSRPNRKLVADKVQIHGVEETARQYGKTPEYIREMLAPEELAPKATPELPASWQALVDKQAGPAMPKPSATPLGIPEHAPMWASPQPLEDNAAKSLRHVFGAEDAGAMMDMSADDVRALSGEAARHRPMVARLADLDRNYMRLVNDPKAALALTGTGTAGIAELMRRALVDRLSNPSGNSAR